MIYLAKAAKSRGHVRVRVPGSARSWHDHVEHGTYGLISAERTSLSHAENHARTKELHGYLNKMNLHPVEADGVYGGAPENSFMISHPNPQHLHNVMHVAAQKYNQDSYIIRHKDQHTMVYPNGSPEHPKPHHLKGTKIAHRVQTTDDRTQLHTPGGHRYRFRMEDFFDNPPQEGLGRSMRSRQRRVYTIHTPEGLHHVAMEFDPTPHPNDHLFEDE